ncbi:MAG: hypothetical protein H7Z39_19000 [Burkholderiaceae bacterium]|nr:hypothetical protein [Burkholderiaceae bacterium]
MATSTLDPDNLPLGNDRVLGGTGALGPSDSSDSGSDLFGAPGLAQQVETGLVTGANDDPEDGADIDVDHIETIPGAIEDLDVEALPGRLGDIETLATESGDLEDVEAAPPETGDVERGPGRRH